MDAIMANWPWLDRAIAVGVLIVVAFTPFKIMAKLDQIIGLLEQIARKD